MKQLAEKFTDDPIARFNLNLDGRNELFCSGGGHIVLDPAEILKKEALLRPQIITDPESGQTYRYLHFNPDLGGRAMIYLSTYGSDLKSPETRYRLSFAASWLEKEIIWIERPNMCEEGELVEGLNVQFGSSGYSAVAASLGRAIAHQKWFEEVEIAGSSMGGLCAPFLAYELHRLGIFVPDVVMAEPAGFTNVSYGQFLLRLLGEAQFREQYDTNPYDETFVNYIRQKTPLSQALRENIERYMIDKTDRFAREASKKDYLEHILLRLLQANPDVRLTLVTGGDSLVCPPQQRARLLARIRTVGEDRVRSIVFPGGRHSLLANPGTFTMMLALTLGHEALNYERSQAAAFS